MQTSDPLSGWKKSKKHFVFQVLSAIIFMAIVLFFMSLDSTSQILWAVGSGSLASSIFIVFTIPNSISAQPRRVLGGYLIAILVGVLIHFLLGNIFNLVSQHFILENTKVFWVSSAIAIGLVMVLMVILDCQHPPAAGISIVLVLNIQEYYTLAVIGLSVIFLMLIKHVFRNYLINLAS